MEMSTQYQKCTELSAFSKKDNINVWAMYRTRTDLTAVFQMSSASYSFNCLPLNVLSSLLPKANIPGVIVGEFYRVDAVSVALCETSDGSKITSSVRARYSSYVNSTQ